MKYLTADTCFLEMIRQERQRSVVQQYKFRLQL
jgi:hypothetical protein